jgi:hypothetical protein
LRCGVCIVKEGTTGSGERGKGGGAWTGEVRESVSDRDEASDCLQFCVLGLDVGADDQAKRCALCCGVSVVNECGACCGHAVSADGQGCVRCD